MKKVIIDFSNLQVKNEEVIKSLIEKYSRPASEVIIDDVDLRNLLKISRRMSLEYRRKGIIKFYKIENKILYILEDVIEGLKTHGSQ